MSIGSTRDAQAIDKPNASGCNQDGRALLNSHSSFRNEWLLFRHGNTLKPRSQHPVYLHEKEDEHILVVEGTARVWFIGPPLLGV
jgi:mannose-6-phosphate isomerase-like protein (cupin superfamily)